MLTWRQMRVWNKLYLHGVLPFFEQDRNRGLGSRMRQYAAYDTLSRDEVRQRQFAAFQELLTHAYSTTTFYRKRFDTVGLRPEDIRTFDDVQRIPYLTRDDLKNHLSEMVSTKYKPEQLCESHTGGTTNAPVDFLRDRASLIHKEAIQRVLNGWAGFWPGDKAMYFWGAQADFAQNPSWRWQIYDKHLMRRVWLQASILDEQALAAYKQAMDTFRPRIVYGYPTTIALFCRYLQQVGGRVHRPHSVISTAEHLEESRGFIEKVLGAPVFEHYGAREFGMIAGECASHRGLHVHPAICLADFAPVAYGGDEPMSEIFVTDLFNHGMPLIRYRSEDFVVAGKGDCPCGRPFETIDHFVGRRFAMFHFADGTSAMGVGLSYRVITIFPAASHVQFVQITHSDFELRYVADREMDISIQEKIAQMLNDFFKQRLTWKAVRLDKIPRERSGKIRPFISHVKPPASLETQH